MTCPSDNPAWTRWTGHIIQGTAILLVLLLLPMAFAPLRYATGVINAFPYQMDREEGFLLNQALTLRGGGSIYAPVGEEPPWVVGNYTPVYPAIVGLLHFPETPSLAVGRVVVLLSVLGIMALLAVALALNRRVIPVALLAPLLFLVTNDVYYWIPFARVDFTALLFTIAAIAWVGRGSPRVYIPACAVLFTLAFQTKQTQLMAPAAATIALILAGRRREGLLLGGATMAFGLVTSLLLLAITRGQYWLHTVTYNQNVYQTDSLIICLQHIWRFSHWCLPALAIGWTWLLLAAIRDHRSKVPPNTLEIIALIYTPLAMLSILAVGKAGSDRNYLLDFHMAGALTTALGLVRIWHDRHQLPRAGTVAAGATLLLLALHANFLWSPFNRMATHRQVPGIESRSAGDFLLLRAVDEPGPILSEDPIYTLLARKEVDYEPFIMTRLAMEGHWDQSPMLERLESRHYRLIIATQPMDDELIVGFTPEMKAAISRNYTLDERVSLLPGRHFFLYRPIPH
ncbi:MAG: DUF2029 domain-containing protein [Candidatus Sumerlaeia bacterium]|nr:DUF2029 domain-containing protein [Candidatus Sumerlaeia bacterium]